MGILFFAAGLGSRDGGGGNIAVSAGPSDFGPAKAGPTGTAAAASKPLPVFVKNSLRFIESAFKPMAIDNSCGGGKLKRKINPAILTTWINPTKGVKPVGN